MKPQLNIENIYAWPTAAKILLIIFLCLMITTLAFYLDISGLLQKRHAYIQTNAQLQNKIMQSAVTTNKSTINTHNKLPNYNSAQLQAVGVIQQAQKIWGILADPSGALHHVTVGSVVGLNNDKVTRINTKEIVIADIVLPIIQTKL